MKRNFKISSLFALVLAGVTLFSCNRRDVVTPSTNEATPSEPESNKPSTDTDSSNDSSNGDQNKEQTVANLISLCPTDGSVSTQRYYVRAAVKSIDNPSYGQMTIEDSTGTLSVYGTYDSKGEKRYSELEDKPVAGDEVLLYGNLQNYKGTPEMKSGWIMEVKHSKPTWNESDYKEMKISDARDADEGTKVKVTGIVSKITYAFKMIPNGFILVGDGSSIYVYDNQLASQVKEGNKVTLLADKTYFVMDNEKANAEKYGYKGACQLANAHLVSNDNNNNDADLSFATEATVKSIMDTSYSENITSKIYHTDALIKKVEGSGFTNYYIDDLDEKTGSYVYTSNSGSDFAWLDEFDGKICSVYFTPLNAKSTTTGCIWRFLPIKVEDKNYKFDKAKAPEFAVKYYGVEQFKNEYMNDPNQELQTEVTSTLLNFGTATLSYTSSDENVVYFEKTKDNKTIFHTKNPGEANVTITGHLDGQKDYSKDVKITVKEAPKINSIDVASAIKSTKDTKINVKGVVGPSLVNQSGFYLIDDTGAIAVRLDDGQFDGLKIGQTVIVSGTRDLWVKSPATFGQQCISNATIALNYYGDTNYSTKSFKTGTLAELLAFPVADDFHTTEVYTVTAGVKEVETAYFSNYYLTSGETEMRLYSSSGSQYSWLGQFADQGELQMEIAVCNWNSKKDFAGCVLSVTNKEGQKIFNTLNFDK